MNELIRKFVPKLCGCICVTGGMLLMYHSGRGDELKDIVTMVQREKTVTMEYASKGRISTIHMSCE